MSTIFIVRHGQDEDNANGVLNGRRDTPLTELGRNQAKTVAAKLNDHHIDVIYCSPLKRARQTAEIIARELGIQTVVPHQDLIEREFGIMTGKLVSDIPKICKRIFAGDRVNYFLEEEGAEDFPTLIARGQTVLQDIQSKHSNANVVIVTHGDIGKMIRAVYHGWTWEEALRTPYFDNTGVLELLPSVDVME